MRRLGLRQEIEQFYDRHAAHIDADLAQLKGAFQSIGVKEFVPYLRLSADDRCTPDGDRLFDEGCERMMIRTRQYSREQRRWVARRLRDRLRREVNAN
jgi:tRNA A37 N6-isopentenylltransferase MiaA